MLRTEYAYTLLAEKDTKKADALWLQFQRCIRSHPYSTNIESEQELIDIARQKKLFLAHAIVHIFIEKTSFVSLSAIAFMCLLFVPQQPPIIFNF